MRGFLKRVIEFVRDERGGLPPWPPSMSAGRLKSMLAEDAFDAGGPFLDVTDFGVVGDGVTDNSPAMTAALVAVESSGRGLFFPAGTYLFNSPVNVPSGSQILAGPDVVFHSGVAAVPGDPFAAMFIAAPTFGGTTTLTANTVLGSRTIAVTDTVGGTIVPGALIQIQSAANLFHNSIRKVVSVMGLAVTLDRPLLDTYAIGDNVTVVLSRPENISIVGNGAKISGTGTRYIELDSAFRSLVSGFRVDASLGMVIDLLFSFDTYGQYNRFVDMSIDCASAAGTVGLALESNENSLIENCYVVRAATAGVALYDCYSCGVLDTSAGGCGSGAVFTADGNTVGGRDNVLVGGDYDDNTIGVEIAFGSDQYVAPRSCAHNSVAGVQTEAGTARTTIANCTLGDAPAANGYVNGGSENKLRNVTIGNALIGLNAIAGDLIDIDGLILLGTFGQNAVESNISVRARGVIGRTSGAINVWLINAGYVDVFDADMTAGNGSNVFNNSAKLTLGNVKLTSAGGGIGIVATAGSLRTDDDVDLGGCTTPVSLAGGQWNRGTVVGSAVGVVAIPFAGALSTDQLIISPTTSGATFPAATVTPGVGATLGVDSTARTWEYVIR